MSDYLNTILASKYPIDLIIGTYTGGFTSLAPTAGSPTRKDVAPVQTNIAETTFYVGIFSLDNGITWYPFEADPTYVPGDNSGDITVYGESTAGTFNVRCTNNYSTSQARGLTFNVIYNFALIAKPNQSKLAVQPIASKVSFDTRKNYQKINLDDFRAYTSPGTVTINHTVGAVPRVRAYKETGGILREIGGISSTNTRVNSSTVTHTLVGANTGTLYTRVYYDV